jgi:glycosyltransferase involved in cell wall biosynthesis
MPMKTGKEQNLNIKPIHFNKEGWPWNIEVNPSIYDSSNDWPKISIVTPSYNQGEFIEVTIRSVLAQNYPHLQYIIIDGGSSDQTVSIIKKYDSLINYWISEKDSGQCNAINKGLQLANGEIFNWLNSDDLLEEGALYKVALAFKNNPVDCVIGDCRHFNNEDNSTHAIGHTQLSENTEKTICHLGMGQPSTYYKLDFVKASHGLNEQLHYAMDTNLWYQFLVQKGVEKAIYIPEIFSHFRLQANSKTVAEETCFLNDVNAIRYALLKSCDCPKVVLDFFKEPTNTAYKGNWVVDKIEPNKLIGYFAHYVGTEYYSSYNYKKAMECYHIAKQYGIKDKALMKQYYKIKYIPKSILNFIRRK